MSSAEELRGYLGRLLGWTNTDAIDHAFRAIDLAREHRAQLVLCGHGDLVPLAHGLHRRALGTETPFIVCDPRRGNTPASVRSPAEPVPRRDAARDGRRVPLAVGRPSQAAHEQRCCKRRLTTYPPTPPTLLGIP
jgi:hypothetical protein